MAAACAGAIYIVHTASPFPIVNPKHENELIGPAVNGTMAVMRAAAENKVKRVVITSSIASIMVNADPKKTHFTTADFTDDKIAPPYHKSKVLAERAAWDFQASLPEDCRMEIVTINPGLIVGPNLNSA